MYVRPYVSVSRMQHLRYKDDSLSWIKWYLIQIRPITYSWERLKADYKSFSREDLLDFYSIN